MRQSNQARQRFLGHRSPLRDRQIEQAKQTYTLVAGLHTNIVLRGEGCPIVERFRIRAKDKTALWIYTRTGRFCWSAPDDQMFKSLYFSIGCFNEGCTHSSWLQRNSSTIHPCESLVLPFLPRLVKGRARGVRQCSQMEQSKSSKTC